MSSNNINYDIKSHYYQGTIDSIMSIAVWSSDTEQAFKPFTEHKSLDALKAVLIYRLVTQLQFEQVRMRDPKHKDYEDYDKNTPIYRHDWKFLQLKLWPIVKVRGIEKTKVPTVAFLAVVKDLETNIEYFTGGNFINYHDALYFFEPIHTRHFNINSFPVDIQKKTSWNHTLFPNGKTDNFRYIYPMTDKSYKDELSDPTAKAFGGLLDVLD
jgi:hypothetical protein